MHQNGKIKKVRFFIVKVPFKESFDKNGTLKNIQSHIEALIFVSEDGIDINDIEQVISQIFPESSLSKEDIENLLENIRKKYTAEHSIFELQYLAKRYSFLTKAKYHDSIQKLQAHKEKRKLSQAALETLSIIAYRQPITKLEIEQIRGVNSDYTVQRLLDRNLIRIMGKAETLGRPLLYGTTDEFLNHFGINSHHELPQLKEIEEESNSIGEEQEIKK